MKVEIPKIPEELKDININVNLLHEVVETYLSNERAGNAKTKDRSEVAGGGKKPWRQKGTGRARHGSNNSPIWSGGGNTFGPVKEQHYKKDIPRLKKQIALVQAIVQRIREDRVKIVEKIELDDYKTRLAADFLENIFEDTEGKKLIVLDEMIPDIVRAFRNIKGLTIMDWKNINTYTVLGNNNIMFTAKAWKSFLDKRGWE
ncbi:MAG: 50S ribosomal protein L4 [Elusimicrobiota bacterium]